MTDQEKYRPLGGAALRCDVCPGAPAHALMKHNVRGAVPVCRICAQAIPGPLLTPLMAETEVFAQALLDDLVSILMDDDALSEMVLDWEVNGGGKEEVVE